MEKFRRKYSLKKFTKKFIEYGIHTIGIHTYHSAVFSGGAGGARAPPEFRGSQKGRSLISAYQSLAITTNTPGFEKLNTALRARAMARASSARTHHYSQCIRPNKQCVQNVFEGAHPYPNALEFSPTYHTDLWGIYANVKLFFWPSQL